MQMGRRFLPGMPQRAGDIKNRIVVMVTQRRAFGIRLVVGAGGRRRRMRKLQGARGFIKVGIRVGAATVVAGAIRG